MGFVFGLLYRRFGRVGPLVVAHFLLDLVSFVGVAVLQALAPGLLPR
jgi:membrane protease YdiL (CAAX protease family)